ncbi:MAG: C4-type zinc ribbon domain-containing protein, partial [Myxococcota bacterium]
AVRPRITYPFEASPRLLTTHTARLDINQGSSPQRLLPDTMSNVRRPLLPENLPLLIQLQKIDKEIYDLNREIHEECPKSSQELAKELNKAKQDHDTIAEKLTLLTEDKKQKETLLREEEDKLGKWEKRLMDSKKHHEASTLAREIDAQKRLNQEMQDEILLLLEQEEQLSQRKQITQQHRDQLQSQFDAAQALCTQTTQQLQSRVDDLESSRGRFTSELPKSLLKRYENIKSRRNGIAVVPATNGCCMGCNMNLPPQLYNTIQQNASLETCPNCKRILYWDASIRKEADSQ